MSKRIYLIIIFVHILVIKSFCQDIEKFNLDYIASDYIDTISKKSVIVVLAATPIKEKDFPPILSMKLTYKVNDENHETVIDIMKQEKKRITLVIYGNEVKTKSQEIFELVKDKVNLDTDKRVILLAFKLEDISDTPIEYLTLWYGLWEKKNSNKRTEKMFKFNIKD